MLHNGVGYKTPKEPSTDRKGQYTKNNKTAEKLGPNRVTENGYKTRHACV